MSLFLYIPKIDGGATEKSHEKWVKVDSMQFGVGRSIHTPVGKATNREAGAPTVSELHVTKVMDKSSIELFGWSVALKDARTCKLDVTSTGQTDAFTSYELENAIVSGYSVSGAGEGLPMESLSLNFTKITEKFYQIGADQKPLPPVNKSFDLATGTAS